MVRILSFGERLEPFYSTRLSRFLKVYMKLKFLLSYLNDLLKWFCKLLTVSPLLASLLRYFSLFTACTGFTSCIMSWQGKFSYSVIAN